MDGFSGKRAVDGHVVSRKSSGLVLRDTVNREKNAQFCSRIGCSSRMNSTKGTQIGCAEKAKSSKPSFRSSSSGKEIIGSSSRNCAVLSNARKSSINPRKNLPSKLETDSSETSSVHDEPDVSEIIAPTGKIQRGLLPESESSDAREVILMEEGSSSIKSNSRSCRTFHQRSGVGNRVVSVGSSISLGSRNTSQATSNTSRRGFRNIRCNSISDVIPSSSSSSSDSSLSRRKDMDKKKNSGECSSSSRGKKTSETSSEIRNHNPNNSISFYELRRTRNWPPNMDNGVASVRTRRSTNGNNRARISNQGNGNSLAPESPVVISRVPESELLVDSNVPTSSLQFSAETPSVRSNPYSRPGNYSGGLRGLMLGTGSPSEVGGITPSIINRDNFTRYNIDGIAEVLLALERIEQDDELSYEQLLALETNFLLRGLNFYDQHREMRLDIDNMSYEELLVLEERMGTVSTALTEEAISQCLKTSTYQFTPLKDVALSSSWNNDDIKCSICQEEYVDGDEVGRLHCQHRYHVPCIQQWLRLKNWCPICKAPAESASSSSSSLNMM